MDNTAAASSNVDKLSILRRHRFYIITVLFCAKYGAVRIPRTAVDKTFRSVQHRDDLYYP